MQRAMRLASGGVGIALPLALGLVAGRLVSPWLPAFVAIVDGLGVWGPLIFVACYALGVVLLFPVFLLIMVGGAVFGTKLGSVLAMTGAMSGGIVAFLVARHVVRAQVSERVARHRTLSALDRAIAADGLKLVFLLRLSPTIPYVLSNYALGVTRVTLREFILGTFGLIPLVVSYAAYGSATGGVRRAGEAPLSPLAVGFGIVATIALGIVVGRIVQRALRERPPEFLTRTDGSAQSP